MPCASRPPPHGLAHAPRDGPFGAQLPYRGASIKDVPIEGNRGLQHLIMRPKSVAYSLFICERSIIWTSYMEFPPRFPETERRGRPLDSNCAARARRYLDGGGRKSGHGGGRGGALTVAPRSFLRSLSVEQRTDGQKAGRKRVWHCSGTHTYAHTYTSAPPQGRWMRERGEGNLPHSVLLVSYYCRRISSLLQCES